MLYENIFDVDMPSAGEAIVRPERSVVGRSRYTTKDRLARVQGVVIMEAIVGEDGRLYQPLVLKSLTPGIDLLALAAICEWRFKPATLKGQLVKVYYTLTTQVTRFLSADRWSPATTTPTATDTPPPPPKPRDAPGLPGAVAGGPAQWRSRLLLR
jgi:TonB family protein